GQIMDPGRSPASAHQHNSSVLFPVEQAGLRRDIGTPRLALNGWPGPRFIDGRIDIAVPEMEREPRRLDGVARMRQRGAVTVGDPSETALQRTVGMREFGQPPKRLQPIRCPFETLTEQLAPKTRRDLVQIRPGVGRARG